MADVQHTFVGDDYPLTYPMATFESVAMTLQETIHLQLNHSDATSKSEWLLLTSIPAGLGRARLGPQQRLFVISMYHQMHCLSKIRLAIVDRQSTDPFTSYDHTHHCFNYLRQTFLCGAAASVEKGDFLQQNFTIDRIGDTLICKDWEKVYNTLDQNDREWVKWRSEWN